MNDVSKFLLAVIDDCEALLNYDVDTSDWDWNLKARMRGIRTSLDDAMRQARDLHDDTAKRVYCIQVTTTIDTNIKVLAKNEDDAIECACETADKRIRFTLAREHDVYYDSTGEVLGHESQSDDDADEEYEYNE